MDSELWKKLSEIVLANSKNEKVISEDTDLIVDLAYDSITTVKLIVDIEREFKITFPDELFFLDKIRQFSSLYEAVYMSVNGVN